MAKIIKNGVEVEAQEHEIQRPPNPPKPKKKEVFGRKNRIIIKWLAARFGITYQQAINEIDAIDNVEPEDQGPQ